MPIVLGSPTDTRSTRGYIAGAARLANPGESPILALQNQAIQAVGNFHAAAPLPPEAGEEMDEIITQVGTQRLSIVAELIREVSRPLTNWWGVITKQHEKVSKHGRARRTMRPGGRGHTSRRDRTPVSTAIYATEEEFDFHQRFIDVAAASGVSLEADSLEQGVLNINETAEDAAINGPGVNFANVSTNYGLETAPNANSVVYSGSNKAWDHASKTGEEILDDVLAMRDAAYADFHFGPFTLFYEKNYETPLDKPYSDGVTTNYNATVRDMIEKITAGGRGIRTVVADQLADDRTALVEMQRTTCGIYVGQRPTWIPFPVQRFDHEFLVLACLVPYFRDDYDGGSGIVLGSVS